MEELTLENLKICRSIIDPIIEEYGGRIFNTAGDSVVAEFSSTVESVNSGIVIQKTLSDRKSGALSYTPRFSLLKFFSDPVKEGLSYLQLFLELPELIWGLRNVPISKKHTQN